MNRRSLIDVARPSSLAQGPFGAGWMSVGLSTDDGRALIALHWRVAGAAVEAEQPWGRLDQVRSCLPGLAGGGGPLRPRIGKIEGATALISSPPPQPVTALRPPPNNPLKETNPGRLDPTIPPPSPALPASHDRRDTDREVDG